MGRIRIIGVPLDLGASRRGVDMGPSALRIAQLEARLEALGHEVEDTGNIRVPEREALPNINTRPRPAPCHHRGLSRPQRAHGGRGAGRLRAPRARR